MIERKRLTSLLWLWALAALLSLGPAPAFAFHFPWDQGHDTFNPDQGDDDTDPGEDEPNECGSPVEVASGNYVFGTQLILITGRGPSLNLTLTYNSRDMRSGAFGVGWVDAYDQRVVETTDTANVFAICSQASGRRERFLRGSDGSFQAPSHLRSGLSSLSSGGYDIREKDGSVRRFTQEGRLSAITDRNGNAVTLQYDGTGFLSRAVDATGRALEFTKGANGRVASVRDPAGRVYRFEYNATGNLIRITDPAGHSTRFQYDAKSNLTGVVDARGNTLVALTYDTSERVRTLRQRAETWTFTYNPAARRTTKADSSGRTWTFDYNENGSITQVTDPLGGIERYVYDANLNVVEIQSSGGGRKSVTYDSRGNPLTVQDASGSVRQLTYEPTFNRLTSIRNSVGSVTRFEYDARGNMVRSIDGLGRTTVYENDAFGQLVRITEPETGTSTMAYDGHGHLVEMVDPLGNRSTATYDVLGKVLSNTDPDGRTLRREYDLNERLVKTIAGDGGETSYSYDEAGNLISLTTPNGMQTVYQYDLHNRLVRVTNPAGQVTTFTYDKHDNVISATDPKGQTGAFAYDALDRLIRKTTPDDVVSFTYDRVGNLLTATDGDSALTFVYDSLNRITEVRTAATAAQPATTIRYTYAGEDTRSTMIDPAGGVTRYEYDDLSRLSRLTDPSGRIFTFAYDTASRRSRVTQGSQLAIDYTYDTSSRLTSMRHTGPPGDLLFAYTYDSNANRLTMTDENGLHSFGFDAANRMVSAIHPGGIPAESYTYDLLGNRTNSHFSTSYTYDSVNRLTSDGVFTYTYDANGNLTRKAELATGRATLYAYDSENRLTRVDLPDGTSASYRYDAMGRRIRKEAGGRVLQYIYDGSDILFEYTDGALSARYTHSDSIDEVLGVERGGSYAYFQADSLGTIRRVVDENGSILASYSYDSFGRLIAETGVPQGPYRFQGREFDAESGLYFYRARYYDPGSGRFLSEDPMGFSAGANFYTFVENNPLGLTDPFGLEVGFWESLIPVWGSGKQAYEDFSCGRWGWGIANTALALSDVLLVKALVTGAAKAIFKTGLRQGMSRPNPAFPRGTEWVEQSHWIPRRSIPEGLDGGWNLKPMWGTDHALSDPARHQFMRRWWKDENPLPHPIRQQLNRVPNGVQGAGAGAASAGGRGAQAGRDSDCGCE